MTRALVVAVAAALAAAAPAVGTSTPAPSKWECAGAWNRHAPASVLAEVRVRHVWQATVQETGFASGTDRWSNGGPVTTSSSTGVGCSFALFLPQGGALVVTAVWRRGAVARWQLPIRPVALGGSGNACVAADGTIHRVGRFTAATRCRRP